MILAAIWFFLPAGLANAAPVFAAKLPGPKWLKTPLDLGKSWRGKRLLGDNKTWRGLVAGILIATLVIALQKYYFTHNLWVLEHSWFDYRPGIIWLLGPLFGLGALLGDAIESFFKRQRAVKPGQPWFPFDQIDYILGGLLASRFIVALPFSNYLWVLGTYFGLHLITVYVGYLLGFRERPI